MRWIPAGLAAAVLAIGIGAVTQSAAQRVCLHGADETPEQAARRKEVITFSRQIHNEQLKAFSRPMPISRWSIWRRKPRRTAFS